MVKHWWKILAAILVIYATVFSFLKPLEPGILDVNISSLNKGENEFIITGYNTHFKTFEKSLNGFLKLDSIHALSFNKLEVIDQNHLRASVIIPENIHRPVLDLFISNQRTGSIFLPRAFNIENITSESISSYPNLTYVNYVAGQDQRFEFPFQLRIFDTIRNLNFHVPMWFTMFVLMGISLFYSIKYLNTSNPLDDLRAASSAKIALIFCSLGLITGSIWARFAWGDWWTMDAKLNGAAVSFLLLAAYFLLRKSAEDKSNKAKIASVYNILSFFMIMTLIMVLPRLTGADTLHPGEDGNPAFSSYDLDSNLRMVFYPACAGWIITGIWIYQLRYRISKLKYAE